LLLFVIISVFWIFHFCLLFPAFGVLLTVERRRKELLLATETGADNLQRFENVEKNECNADAETTQAQH
jgi:hypothetical protein